MKYDPRYDFSNRGVDWQDYMDEVRLRTDAAWEKQKLKDYFRLFYKVFYWDPKSQDYYISVPGHNVYNTPDGWRFKKHHGYTPTGKTNSFSRAHGVEYASRTASLNYSDTFRDKNALCYYRFRAFKKCEGDSLYPRTLEAESNPRFSENMDMGCYQEMTEMLQYCSNVQLNWLADLWHHMELNNDPTHTGPNDEITMMLDEFDNPDVKVYSY